MSCIIHEQETRMPNPDEFHYIYVSAARTKSFRVSSRTSPVPPPENIGKESTKNWNKSPLTWDSCFFNVNEILDRVFSLLVSI